MNKRRQRSGSDVSKKEGEGGGGVEKDGDLCGAKSTVTGRERRWGRDLHTSEGKDMG